MILVKDLQEQKETIKVLNRKVDNLENDLIKREAKNKVVLWIVGIVAAFFGAVAAEWVGRK